LVRGRNDQSAENVGGPESFGSGRVRSSADTAGVGRTNWILAGIGLLACIALSLMMQHSLGVRDSRGSGSVVAAVDAARGARLTGRSRFRSETRGRARVGTLTVQPLLGENSTRLAADVGETAWLALGREGIDRLLVVLDAGVGAVERFEVDPPWSSGRRAIRLAGGSPAAEEPVAAPPARR
jgi:hypothetical protein